jgi:hypothetical protein
MNKVVVFRPTAERRHSIREGFPRTGDYEVAPDAPCLRDYPVCGVPGLREDARVFQQTTTRVVAVLVFLMIKRYMMLVIIPTIERRRRAAASLIGGVIQRRRCGS